MMETNTILKREPIVFSGSGSAIDNYMKPAPEQEKKEENWGSFTKTKPDPKKRAVLFSLLHQANWTIPNKQYGRVPDLERLSKFLKSDKSPVNKKLVDMKSTEVEKIIKAFKGIVKSTWK